VQEQPTEIHTGGDFGGFFDSDGVSYRVVRLSSDGVRDCRSAAPRSHGKAVMELITEYIFYCKRAILFLSSSKILNPPLRPASVSFPPTKAGVHTRRAERGGRVNILEDEGHRIALLQ
jgi:hypothetical protein